MKLSSWVKRLSLRQVVKVSFICLQYPRYIVPTIQATQKTIVHCSQQFGKAQHANGKANAYRHALWNWWICNKTYAINQDQERAMAWAKKITDLHEKLAPNPMIETAMDLHNNAVGRELFYNNHTSNTNEIVNILLKMIQQSQRINSELEIPSNKHILVYIEEPN